VGIFAARMTRADSMETMLGNVPAQSHRRR